MAEDLTKLWGNFSLLDEESEEVEIRASVQSRVLKRRQLCMVGKLIADRVISKEIIKSKLIRGWRPSGSISFKVLGENLFLIEFEHSWDKSRVLEGRPWIFEGILFSVEDYDGTTPSTAIEFEKVSFWVCIFHLPLDCMGQEVRYHIG